VPITLAESLKCVYKHSVVEKYIFKLYFMYTNLPLFIKEIKAMQITRNIWN